jgi:hypothetical protein
VSASVPRAVRMCVWTAPYSSMCVGRKWEFALCQNCVTYPPKPWGNTVTYGHTSTHIDVAEIVESEVRWWDLVCVSTRERIQFPSVRDRGLEQDIAKRPFTHSRFAMPCRSNRLLTCATPMKTGIVSDLLIPRDHLQRFA